MKTFGIQLQEGSSISNLTVGAGTAFPADPNEGELFYRSDADITVVGLYAYINGNWDRISSSDSITAPKAASFPGTANVGDIFYKDSNDSNEGLYVYNGSTWESLTATATTFHVDAPTEVTLASTDNAIQLGATSGLNLVMDSTEIQARSNGGASPLMLNPHGSQLLIGKDSVRSVGGVPRLVQIEQAGSTTSLQLIRNSNDIIDPNIQLGKTRSTSVGGNDIVQSGDALGSLSFLGATGTDLFTSAFVQVRAWGTISSTSVPARMDWSMTPEGGTTAAIKMSLMPDGQLLIGTQSVSDNEKLHVVTTSDGSNPVLQYLTNSGTTSGTGSTLAFAANTNSTAHTTLGTIAGVSSNATGSGNLIFSTATSGTVSEKMRITAAGNVGIGTTSPASAVQIGGDSAYRELRLRRSIDTATLAQAIAFYRTRGTEGAPTVVSSGDTLGSMIFTAFDGTTTGNAAWIQGAADNTISSNSTPGRLVFSTTATGAVTPTERMRIDSTGQIGVGLTPSTVLDIKSKYGFSAASNGAIRIENYNSTTFASYLDNIIGTALYDDSSYYGTAQRTAKDTTSSGILMSAGSIALTTDSGLTAGNQFTPTTRVNIDTSGHVGIGTTAAANRRLDILYNANTAARVQFTNTDAGTGADARIVASNGASEIGIIMRGTGFTSAAGQGLLYVTNDNPIVFSTNGAERARIDTVGLGVGGTAASRVVEVHNNTRAIARLSANATTGTDALGAIEFSSYDGTSVGVGATIIHTYNLQSSDPNALTINVIRNAPFVVKTNNAERMRIDGSGNVAIGGSIAGKLHVSGGSIRQTNLTDGTDGFLQFNAAGTRVGSTYGFGTTYYRVQADSGVGRLALNTVSGYINFEVNAVEKMRMTNNGEFLIGGTASRPLSAGAPMKLQVESIDNTGGLSTTRNTADSFGPNIRMLKTRGTAVGAVTAVTSGDWLGQLQWYGTDGTNILPAAEIRADVDTGPGTNDMPGRLVFSTTADGGSTVTERMRLDSAGNLAIGRAPSTAQLTTFEASKTVAASGIYRLATLRAVRTTADYTVRLGFGGYRDVDADSLIASIDAEAVNGTVNAALAHGGHLIFRTSADGATANTLERMRIDSGGIVQVGQTTATGDAKIQVSNGVRFGGTTSTDVNTLDFYQEGTFTPVVAGSTTAGTGTYTTQVGTYTRIGNTVHFNVTVVWTAHTGTGNLLVNGLPFTSNATANRIYSVSVSSSNLTFTGQLGGRISNSATSIAIETQSSGAAIAALAIDTAASLWITGTYQV